MDRLDRTPESNTAEYETLSAQPNVSITALRQTLVEMRKQARLHDREALVACLTLAISLTKTNPAN